MELFIAKPEEASLFFSWDDGRDAAYGCIGHMRGDFEGNILHHTWWPHYWDALYNNAAFKADLTRVVDWLRVGFAPLKNLENMGAFCARYAHAAIPGQDRAYGFRIETKRYRYMLRCTPVEKAYHVYNPPFCERHRRGYETRVLSPEIDVCYTVHGSVRYTTETVEMSGGAV